MKSGEKATEVCGTLTYCAPEILSNEPYSFSCDYWSIGVVIFILLTGDVPYYDDDDEKMTNNIFKGSFDESYSDWNEISVDAQHLIKSLL